MAATFYDPQSLERHDFRLRSFPALAWHVSYRSPVREPSIIQVSSPSHEVTRTAVQFSLHFVAEVVPVGLGEQMARERGAARRERSTIFIKQN